MAAAGLDTGQGYKEPKPGNQDQEIEPWTHKEIVLQCQGFKPWTYQKDCAYDRAHNSSYDREYNHEN